MSALYAGVQLCQSTPEVRAWVERHVSTKEVREFQWPSSAPNIFQGLTYWPHNENNVPLRLNVLRWPSGASRWATYHFLATDDQLNTTDTGLRDVAFGTVASPTGSAAKQLILHGGGETVTADQMWLLPPRPLSETPAILSGKNKLWLCTLVDQRYWWNQNHCGALDEFSTWDELLTHLRDQAGYGTGADTNAWDCPAVDGEWLSPHVDLLNAHSLPLGLMIDAVAWNVGRRVSIDLERTSNSYPPIIRIKEYDWHNTRSAANLAQPWYRMAGGDFAFPGRDLDAVLPEKIRVTFADTESARDYKEISVNDADLVDYTSDLGTGTVVFHDRLDVADADDTARTKLLKRVAKAYLGFQAKGSFEVVYTGHVKWLPEAISDVVEWHELHGEGECLVPDPTDGKVRQRKEFNDMARTRVLRQPFNLLADDLWHGNGGVGSGSVPNPDYTGTCPDGTTFTVSINGHEINVSMPDDE